MERELEHKNAPRQKASSRLKHSKFIIHRVWDISGSDYKNDSCNVICVLFIILDQITIAKLMFLFKNPVSFICNQCNPKSCVMDISCLEDHILHLEIDWFLSRIIQYWTAPDINMNIWKSHLLKMALEPSTVFLWFTHSVSSCYKLLYATFIGIFHWNALEGSEESEKE